MASNKETYTDRLRKSLNKANYRSINKQKRINNLKNGKSSELNALQNE